MVGQGHTRGRGKLPVLREARAAFIIDDRCDVCQACFEDLGMVSYQRWDQHNARWAPEDTEIGKEWLRMLRAHHGALWLSGRPDHVADNHFGSIVDTICEEKTNGKLAAKLEAARFLVNHPIQPRAKSAVSTHPPPFPRRPAHSVDQRRSVPGGSGNPQG